MTTQCLKDNFLWDNLIKLDLPAMGYFSSDKVHIFTEDEAVT